MASSAVLLLLSLLTFAGDTHSQPTTTSLYLSPKTIFSNYDNMLQSFKIFVYAPPSPFTGATVFTTSPESQFYTSLLRSPFLTEDPSQAHLFVVPFPSSISTRNLARLIRTIRTNFPFWNRTLGADHVYLSTSGVESLSDRNIVELKKNSIQISRFPTSSGLFIPHKDLTLPLIHQFQVKSPVKSTSVFLGYLRIGKGTRLSSIEEIRADPQFKVEEIESTAAAEEEETGEMMKKSRFCLFVYGEEMTLMVEAMASGCVPVVITDRPIQDLPLMEVVRWSEIVVFVGCGGGGKGLRRVLEGIEKSGYEEMVKSGVAASRHLVWNAEPQPYDAFHMIVYQLWLRRHTIRYARWVEQ